MKIGLKGLKKAQLWRCNQMIFDILEHINTVKNLKELEEKFNMSKILYSGVRDCDRYNRFMLIGIK